MLRRFFSVVCFAILGLIACAPKPGAAAASVEAKGVATVGAAGLGKARDDAIADAMRKAVESAVGSLVASQTMIENYQLLSDKIYTQSSGYVTSHEVVEEHQSGNLYWVTIRAEVSSDKVEGDLAHIGVLSAQKELPRVAVLIGEQSIGFYGWDVYWTDIATTESTVMEALQEKGFQIIDTAELKRTVDRPIAEAAYGGDLSAERRLAASLGPRFGADLVIVGKAVAKDAGSILGSQLRSVQANVVVRAVRPDTGEVLGIAQAHAAKAHADSASGGAAALGEAGKQAAAELAQEIATKWAQEIAGTTLVTLSVVGADFARYNELQASLAKDYRGVKTVMDRGYADGRGSLEIRLAGSLSDLLGELDGKELKGSRITVVERTQNSAVLKL
ncbi:MAG: flagellar assembly protein T N-terminal domain-containing protein [Candidatus Schekmanbacteria bacterium]|nr:flagellar assembly protein T N-terminal domain-containing protein [Candidatus Schekmanbacteria bacterium]